MFHFLFRKKSKTVPAPEPIVTETSDIITPETDNNTLQAIVDHINHLYTHPNIVPRIHEIEEYVKATNDQVNISIHNPYKQVVYTLTLNGHTKRIPEHGCLPSIY